MLKNEVEDMASKEETMWKQRAKALWLAEGDRSTSFFHARANERRLQKEIWKIKDVQGLEVKYVGGEGHVSLKLDVRKAYDQVEWSFLERVLIKLGFHKAFNKMISKAKVEGYVEGDGNSVLLGHPWIPRPLSFQLICKLKTFAENTRVSASINSDCKWNKELVEAEFSPLDAKCILGVRLQDTRLQDKLMWHYEKHGRFTVGSAYGVAQEQSKIAGGSLPGYPWRYIWKSKAPMKVLMFAWRYAKDALPTSVSLSKQGIVVIEGCYGCLVT
ncbi:UNVERIFIED_CONTAM: hypothetical protein Sangu_0189000 [Sesamum angustifolium]|uniref:Reverse transcriptase zinc-binding domain-containing protein n=1 Tax=Sesamum angustifolium TaxID=2727405 RepID=A0AAW2RM97_9LAMI